MFIHSVYRQHHHNKAEQNIGERLESSKICIRKTEQNLLPLQHYNLSGCEWIKSHKSFEKTIVATVENIKVGNGQLIALCRSIHANSFARKFIMWNYCVIMLVSVLFRWWNELQMKILSDGFFSFYFFFFVVVGTRIVRRKFIKILSHANNFFFWGWNAGLFSERIRAFMASIEHYFWCPKSCDASIITWNQ